MATFPRSLALEQMNARYQLVRRQLDAEPDRHRASAGATAGGDNRKLRGIPVIGYGVTGAIPGTRP